MGSQTNVVLWGAMLASQVIYIVVAHVADLGKSASDAPIDSLLPAFAMVSVAMAIGTLIHRRRALSEPIRAGRLDPSVPPGQERAFQVLIINLVISEAVGIQGLVLSFLSGEPIYAVGFCGAALFLLYLHRPTAADLVPSMSRDAQASRPGTLHP